MPSLRELQIAFLDGTLHGYPAQIASLIAASELAPEARVAIYANNAREGFLSALAATFPVIERLAGADWFRQTGRDYMSRHPSCSGNLHFVGERFAAFLEDALRGTDFAYFADVARLEWAYQEVLVAADHPSFDISALSGVSPDAYDSLVFRVHPALQLIESRYPVLAIWKANQPGAVEQSISLDAGSSRVLIIRREDHVELRQLPAAGFALLRAFMQGATLSEAFERAAQADPNADLAFVLGHVVKLQALVDFEIR
ncbi:MAG TPA: DNA-binding domain-containing protein [Steroidobacteraceae bacterium]